MESSKLFIKAEECVTNTIRHTICIKKSQQITGFLGLNYGHDLHPRLTTLVSYDGKWAKMAFQTASGTAFALLELQK